MAVRPVFKVLSHYPFYEEIPVDFKYYGGFSLAQKRRCIESMHEAALRLHPDMKLLEISSKSPDMLGTALSAFSLDITLTSGRKVILESVFQGSKVFENGGPYTDLYYKSPAEAKKDPRIRNSGGIIGFQCFGTGIPSEPKDYFYNWLYINTIHQKKDLCEALMKYDGITDIEFNPVRSLNCQARAAAIYAGVSRAHLIEDIVSSKESFLKIIYHESKDNPSAE